MICIKENMEGTTQKGSLPDGWIVKVSKNFPDRIYYFNVNTGSSTWECPKLNHSQRNKNKKSKDTDISNNEDSNKHAAVYHKSTTPDFSLRKSTLSSNLPQCKIAEFLSLAKKESKKRLAESETPVYSEPSKLYTPPTAVVAPVVLDKKSTSGTKKKKSKGQTLAPSLQTPSASKDIKVNGSSAKVSFAIKAQNKIFSGKLQKRINKLLNKLPSSQLQNETHLKSQPSTTMHKQKRPLRPSIPKAEQKTASTGSEKRCVTIDKNNILPSSVSLIVDVKNNKTSSNANENFTLQNRKGKLDVLAAKKVRKQCSSSNENRLYENYKRGPDVLTTCSGTDLSTSKPLVSYGHDSELSDMDCEMYSDVEELTNVLSPALVNIGASTSRSCDPDSFEDIEMLDVSCNDMVKIDDIFQTPGFEGSLLESYFIVVDTNVLLRDLKYIDEMKDTPVDGCGPPHFIIPWVVFQELDGLKRSGGRSKSFDLIKSAGDAIRYLNTLLKAKHPRFHSQHPDEAKNCRKEFSRNNDDKLLECCFKLQERMPNEKVILLTYDLNLANKAMVCKVVVHDTKSLLKSWKPDILITENSPTAKNNVKLSNPVYIPDSWKLLAEEKSHELKYLGEHKECEMEIHARMSEARQMLKDVLDPFFEKEMDEAYGDAWHFFPVERHILKGILYGIVKYWRTVFTFLFPKEYKVKFELLEEKAKRPEGFLGEREECLTVLNVIEEIFVYIKRKWPDKIVPVAQINEIKFSTERAFLKLSECEKNLTNVESTVKKAEMSYCIDVFNHNWTVINHLCGCALDFCRIPHDLVYDASAPVPPKSEFVRTMPELHRSLGELKNIMGRMLEVVKSSSPNGAVFKELRKTLVEIVPSLGIQVEKMTYDHFSKKLLERFCRLPENRQRIEGGYKQLVNFHEKLDRVVQVLLSDMA